MRRSFTAHILGGLLGLGVFCGCAEAVADEISRYERTERHMGTQFTITLYAAAERQSNAAFQAAFARIQQLDQTLSNYQSDSEISRLNSSAPHAQPVEVSEDTWRVLHRAQQISHMTDGAFDVTLGPLTRLWRRARQRQQLPDATRLARARQSSGFRSLRLIESTRSVQLERPGMRLDLGGIAKGDALDQALHELARQGIRRALINGGGDVLASEAPPGRAGWQVGLVELANDRVTDSMQLANRAAATSGDLWQYVQINDTRYSHIIDPRTGYGLTHRSTVTVTARAAIDADALASAISVLGPKEGLDFVSRQADVEARIVYEQQGRREIVASPGFESHRSEEDLD